MKVHYTRTVKGSIYHRALCGLVIPKNYSVKFNKVTCGQCLRIMDKWAK